MRRKDSFWQMALPDNKPGGDEEVWITEGIAKLSKNPGSAGPPAGTG